MGVQAKVGINFLCVTFLILSGCSSYQENSFPSNDACQVNCTQGNSLPFLGEPLTNIREEAMMNPSLLQVSGDCFISNFKLDQQRIDIYLEPVSFGASAGQTLGPLSTKCEHGRYLAFVVPPTGYFILGTGYRLKGSLVLGGGSEAKQVATFEKSFAYGN